MTVCVNKQFGKPYNQLTFQHSANFRSYIQFPVERVRRPLTMYFLKTSCHREKLCNSCNDVMPDKCVLTYFPRISLLCFK